MHAVNRGLSKISPWNYIINKLSKLRNNAQIWIKSKKQRSDLNKLRRMVIFLHGILFLRCHARLKSRLRAAVMWQMHVINKPSFVLCSFQIQVLNRRLLWLRVRLILVFVTILQKYISTLRIAWTVRCCFYHEPKMGMTPQRLLCTLKGSGSGSIRSTRSCVLIQESSLTYVLYTMFPLYA